MTELGDRLLILIVAGTGLLVLIAGWAGGLVQAELGGTIETIGLAALGALFLLVLAAIWKEFDRID